MLDLKALKTPIVGPVSLRVARGECVTISGPSGSGKSLLLRMIGDLDPHAGSARLGELNRASIPAPEWRRRVTYVAAESGWWAETARDHIAAPRLDAARALAARLSLDPGVFDRAVRLLSTGERQRLALVRALVGEPEVLLLDEPTSALDPAATAQVETLLRERLAAGTIVILVTHDEAQGDRLGTRRYRMTHGALAPR